MPGEPRRRLFVDIAPLRESRQFRLLYAGQLVSLVGRQITVVAVPYQVFLLTESSLMVGLVSLAQFAPLLLGSLAGGAVADAFDRRRLLMAAQLVLAVTSVGLAVNAGLSQPRVWPLFVLSALNAGVSAVESPTRSAIVPSLVTRRRLPAAFALHQTGFQLGQVAGPALAGVVIAQLDLGVAFALDAATYGLSAMAVFAMQSLIPEGGGRRPSLAGIVEGFRFLRGRRVLQSTFYIDINAMVLAMPRALFPALGTVVFGGGAATVGLLFAAPGAGALVGALTSGWVGHVRRQGRAVLVAVAVWGAAIAGFGLSPWLPLALVLLAVAGAADTISAVFRSTILQLRVPDRLRGRLSATHIAVVAGGPRLGDARAGAVAALTSPRFSIVSGGLACLLGVVILARAIPEFGRADIDDDAVREAESGM